MPELPALLVDAVDRADATLVAGGYRAVSVSAERVRAWLRFRGLAYLDPTAPTAPELRDLDRTADTVIARAAALSGAMGGAAGIAGAPSIPPEALGTAILVLRMAQRLCVVYGFDPATDRGQMALARGLAAAWEVELPETGAFGLRVSDLPALFRPGASPRAVGGRLVKAMTMGAVSWVAYRLTRFVPLVSAPVHALDNRSKVEAAGRRMQGVLRRLTEVGDGSASLATMEEAVEVRSAPASER
jgi:hypothetical protein